MRVLGESWLSVKAVPVIVIANSWGVDEGVRSVDTDKQPYSQGILLTDIQAIQL